MKKLIIIQARSKSTRLPGKSLREICGKKVVRIIFDNCIKTGYDVVVAIPDSDILNFSNIIPNDKLFCGSENDVLDRFYSCALSKKMQNDDIIVRITSDCPLIPYELINECVNHFLNISNIDYITTTNFNVGNHFIHDNEFKFPDGFDIELFKFSALESAHKFAVLNEDKEHVTQWIRRNCLTAVYNPGKILLDISDKYSIDTIDDFNRISKIIEEGKSVWQK